jgi:hypothetical protein
MVATHIQQILGYETSRPIQSDAEITFDPFLDYFREFLSYKLEDDDDVNSCLVDTSSLAQQAACTLLPHVEIPSKSNLTNFLPNMVRTLVDSSAIPSSVCGVIGSSSAITPASITNLISIDIPSVDHTASPIRKTINTAKFLPLDLILFEKVCNLDKTKSIKIKQWAQNRFNA